MNEQNQKTSQGFLNFSILINSVIIFCLFYFLAQTRNIDGDEGLYLEAARLVAQGKALYLDFFYQQMPLLPYLYAGWMKVFGFDFFVGRWFSALITAISGGFLLVYVARKTKNLMLINLFGLLFFANGLILAWAPVVKTHPLSLFGLTASCVLLLIWKERQSWWLIFLAGLAIGVGVNSRLTLGPFILIYLGFILLKGERHRWRDSIIFIFTVALVSLPAFLYFFSDPQLFIKYNLLYHTQVYPGIVSGERRLSTAQNLFLQMQVVLLFLAAQGSILLVIKRGWKKFLSSEEAFIGLLLLSFIVIHMASAEPYTQYFVSMVPLLLMLAVPAFEWIWGHRKILSVPVVGLFVFFYLSHARFGMNFEISSMLSNRPEWSLSNINKTVNILKKTVKPNEYCLTWWPGFAFMAGCRSVPGMENHMRNYGVQRLNQQEMGDYKMLSDEDLYEMIRHKKYRVIIDSNYHIGSPLYDFIANQIDQNYIHAGRGVKVQYDEGMKLFDLVYREALQGSIRKSKGKRSPRI